MADTEFKDIVKRCTHMYLVAEKYGVDDLKAWACPLIGRAGCCGPMCDDDEIDTFAGLRVFFDHAVDLAADIEDVVAAFAVQGGSRDNQCLRTR